MQIKRLAFVAFPVSDLKQARAFYSQKLGATILVESGEAIDFDMGGTRIRTYLHKGEYHRQHSGLQFSVDDVEGAFTELTLAGVRPRSDVRTEPWGGKVFTLADPDGNLFDLLEASYLGQ